MHSGKTIGAKESTEIPHKKLSQHTKTNGVDVVIKNPQKNGNEDVSIQSKSKHGNGAKNTRVGNMTKQKDEKDDDDQEEIIREEVGDKDEDDEEKKSPLTAKLQNRVYIHNLRIYYIV
jgi:hypothetical protein